MDYKSIICGIILMEVYMEFKNKQNHKNFKNAFTLAEVLITLGIIGVVAAMTLPTLIANYQKQVYANGLKKGINTTLNMLKKMQADEGVSSLGETELYADGVCKEGMICEDAYGNPSVFERIIPKYLKVVKICRGNDCEIKYKGARFEGNSCSDYDLGNNCKLSVSDNLLPIVDVAAYTTNNGDSAPYVGFYTADGMIYYISPILHSWHRIDYVNVFVDINGEKGPNISKRDLFSFYVDADGKLKCYDDDATCYIMNNGYNMTY